MKLRFENINGYITNDSEFALWQRYLDALHHKGNILEQCSDSTELLLLRGSIAIEYFLDEVIKNYLRGGEVLTSKLQYLSQKLQIVESFEVIDQDVISVIQEISKIRNKCAHQLDFRISKKDISQIIGKSSTLRDRVKSEPNILLSALGLLLLELSFESIVLFRDSYDRNNTLYDK